MGFWLGEITGFLQWADENGLEVSIKPAGVASAAKHMFNMGHEEQSAAWAIHHAAGSFWLCRMGDWTEHDLEGSNGAIASADDATARIIVATEARPHGRRETALKHRINTGHALGT